ncbi:2-oxoglutarate dehydrogenase, E2 component, dihydrolipoamide succinyltransferase, partial [Streptomyces sp. NPDC059695]
MTLVPLAPAAAPAQAEQPAAPSVTAAVPVPPTVEHASVPLTAGRAPLRRIRNAFAAGALATTLFAAGAPQAGAPTD